MYRIFKQILKKALGKRGMGRKFRVKQFYKREAKMKNDYERLAHALLALISFRTAYDIGCANGFLIKNFRDNGIWIKGNEISEEIKYVVNTDILDSINICDFSQVDLSNSVDSVLCVEVAEHIEPKRSEELVIKISELSKEWVYFTAAPPGQPGHGHINCRPANFWIKLFQKNG